MIGSWGQETGMAFMAELYRDHAGGRAAKAQPLGGRGLGAWSGLEVVGGATGTGYFENSWPTISFIVLIGTSVSNLFCRPNSRVRA